MKMYCTKVVLKLEAEMCGWMQLLGRTTYQSPPGGEIMLQSVWAVIPEGAQCELQGTWVCKDLNL